MLLGASNHCSATAAAAAAVAAASKNGTDFSIAAIMSRGSLSREPSERSLSKYTSNQPKCSRYFFDGITLFLLFPLEIICAMINLIARLNRTKKHTANTHKI